MALFPGLRIVAGAQGGTQEIFVKRTDDNPLYVRVSCLRGQFHPRPKEGLVPGTQSFLKGE